MSECTFCRIIAGEQPASFVHEDETVCAFLDIQPINPGHLLVVPRMHADAMSALPSETARHMMEVAQGLMNGLRETNLRCEGVNLLLADGEVAGQEVAELAEFAHVHLHVIPRYTNDGFGFRFASDYGNQPQREELDKVAAAIREAMHRA
ncbi:HIT family protein [Candidatus Bipolaricaulota bacterium]|nr:HIT family protein [Candidatus Bipolaricaulota bacterium]